jgi:signal transduction histidine kinase
MKLVNKVSLFTLSSSLLVLLFGGGMIFVFFDKIIKDDNDKELSYYVDMTRMYLENGVPVSVLEKNQNLSIDLITQDQLSYTYPFFDKVEEEFDFPPPRGRRDDFDYSIIEEAFEKVRITIDVSVKDKWYRIKYSRNKIAPPLLFFTSFKSVFILLMILLLTTILGNRLLFKVLFKPFYATLNQLLFFNVAQKGSFKFTDSKINEFSFLNNKLRFFAQKIQDDYAQLKEFSENASHELQTPLAIIRSKLDLLQQSKNLDEKDLIRIEEIQDTLQKANQLNRTLLLLNKIGNQEFIENKTIDVKLEIETNLKYFSEMISLKQLHLSTELEAFEIESNPYLVDLLFRNLIQNAIKHNFIGGHILIISKPRKIMIINDGEPLEFPAEDYFKRFKKGSQKLQSTGLGLAIVAQIIEAEDFEIKYTNTKTLHKMEVIF